MRNALEISEPLMRFDSSSGAAWIYDDITTHTVLEVSRFLRETYEAPVLQIDINNNHERRDIILEIMSGGGCVKSALSIYDMLRRTSEAFKRNVAKPHIITVGVGLIASSATLIFAAGDQRLAYKHTTFLFHQPEILGLFGVSERIAREGEYLQTIETQMTAIYNSVIKKKGIDIAKKIKAKSDLIISAQEALEWGLVTEIL
jgi:ATP-dependent protease ClpP protease subunit